MPRRAHSKVVLSVAKNLFSFCMKQGLLDLSSRTEQVICFFLVLLLSAIVLNGAPKAAPRPRIFRIQRVQILTTDISQARAFYIKVLDNARDCEWCEKVPGRTFSLNYGQIIGLSPAPSPVPSNLIEEITLATENIEELDKYLSEQKIQVSERNKADNGMGPSLSVVDPEGHKIRFVQSTKAPLRKPGYPLTPPNNLYLIHAGFIVHDRTATEHFYKDILGFRPYWRGGMKDDQTDWVSMQVPDGTDWLEFMVNVSADADQRVRGIMNHIAIGVTDIRATEHRLKNAGVNLTEEPKIGRDGKWQLNVYDPDLTRVEFMEFKPVKNPCCSEFTGAHPQP
jgi:catechol 2,3-dioxygenase-like lactoylglutathione lyase family enzyme/predicted enzyme related to lactoylglutathione lyase